MLATASSKNKYYVFFLLWLLSCNVKTKKYELPFYNSADFTPVFITNEKEITNKITHTIAPFSFTDQDNKTITEKEVKGKIHVADFIFTTCGSICPVITDNLTKASQMFEKDSNVKFLSYSVTPWIDTPDKLKEYKRNHHIGNKNWCFLTGDKAAIYKLARTSYFAEEDLGFSKDSTQFLHTEHLLLVDPSMRIRGVYNGTLKLEIEQLIKDIELLKKEL